MDCGSGTGKKIEAKRLFRKAEFHESPVLIRDSRELILRRVRKWDSGNSAFRKKICHEN